LDAEVFGGVEHGGFLVMNLSVEGGAPSRVEGVGARNP